MTSRSHISDIRAGEKKKISKIPISASSHWPNLGTACITKVYDHQKQQQISAQQLPKPAAEVSYDFTLDPPATDEEHHAGLESEQFSANEYAMTQQDAELRDATRPLAQKYACFTRYPAKDFELSLNFPAELAPNTIEVNVDRNGGRLRAETERARSNFSYDPTTGTAHLRLSWLMPNESYEFSWDPSPIALDETKSKFFRAAAPYYDALLTNRSKHPDKPINVALTTLRTQLLDSGLKDSVKDAEALEIGLFMFLEDDKRIRPIAGTYSFNNPIWDFSLKWGVGIRGTTMRRGKPVFYMEEPGKRSQIYKPYEHCKSDAFLLAIPLGLPPGMDFGAYLNFYRVVMSIHSVSRSSGLENLKDLESRTVTCQVVQTAFDECVRALVGATSGYATSS